MPDTRFDVVAVNLFTNKVSFFGERKDYQNAEAIVKIAVMRRGLDEEFYAITPAGMYQEGETYRGNGGARAETEANA